MKAKLIWVSFLLLLYIGPMIFISSYASPAILAEPNINKDLSLSTEYETSDESITSFAETLPDDVLYYPDSDNILVQNAWDDWDSDSSALAIKYNDYNATKTNTTTEYDPSVSGGIQPSDSFVMAWGYKFLSNTVNVQFNFTLPSLVTYTSLTLNTIMSGSADTNTLATTNNGTLDGGWYIRVWNWDTSSYDQLDYKNSGLTWGYSTALDIDNADYFNSTTRTVMIKYSVSASHYVGIWIYSSSITLGKTDYTESFADVSDWSFDSESAGLPARSFTTDGDVLNFSISYDDVGNEWAKYDFTVSAYSGFQYLEVRYKTSQTVGNTKSTRLTLYVNDVSIIDSYSADWHTWKGYIADDISEPYTTIVFMADDYANTHDSGYGYVLIDYLRIGNSTSMGWAHDGSTTAGTIEVGAMSVSTDSDVLHCVGTGSSYSSVDWKIDNTATESDLLQSSYPFIEFRWKAAIGQDLRVQLYDEDDASDYSYLTETGDWVITTYNAQMFLSTGSYYSKVRIRDGKDNDQDFYVDYIKFYNIANFTLTQSGATINDYLYVDSGVLYSNIDSGYIETNHNPALSIVTGVNSLWTLTTSSGTPESDYYVSAWAGYSSETEGSLANGDLTDLKLKFTDDANVAAITFFIAPPQWYESGEVELLFSAPIDETGLDMLLIFLGLIMIPLSTLYLVKGGRSEMSSDKLFYGLIAFAIGWALFLGGIM